MTCVESTLDALMNNVSAGDVVTLRYRRGDYDVRRSNPERLFRLRILGSSDREAFAMVAKVTEVLARKVVALGSLRIRIEVFDHAGRTCPHFVEALVRGRRPDRWTPIPYYILYWCEPARRAA